ncbi:hypothetical protein MMC25_004951 [Agyrium rufum]|nr:hypothetical protein [Agyrium rufum]
MIFTWNKILEINWKKLYGKRNAVHGEKDPIEGTNGATRETVKSLDEVTRFLLSAIEVPLFGAAILAILIVGERNFFSTQVRYQTEPIQSIGQWAPIVGTGLAALGSLYVLFATEDALEEKTPAPSIRPCHCQDHDHLTDGTPSQQVRDPESSQSTHDDESVQSQVLEDSDGSQDQAGEKEKGPMRERLDSSPSRHVTDRQQAGQILGEPLTMRHTAPAGRPHPSNTWSSSDVGNRRKIFNGLYTAVNYIGTPAPKRFDDSEFRRGKAQDFPEIPGEEHRNPELLNIRKGYNHSRIEDDEDNAMPVIREPRSRAGSFVSNVPSDLGIERVSSRSGGVIPQSTRSRSPSPCGQRLHTNSLPPTRLPFDSSVLHPPSHVDGADDETAPGRATLDVPGANNHASRRRSQVSSISIPPPVMQSGPRSPAIVISPDT